MDRKTARFCAVAATTSLSALVIVGCGDKSTPAPRANRQPPASTRSVVVVSSEPLCDVGSTRPATRATAESGNSGAVAVNAGQPHAAETSAPLVDPYADVPVAVPSAEDSHPHDAPLAGYDSFASESV